MNCNDCNSELTPNAKFCTSCGANQKNKINCPSCQKELDAKQKFCVQCGTNIQAESIIPGLLLNPEYLAQQISLESVDGNRRSGITVPAGSVGVSINNGKITESLAPGQKMSPSWTEKLLKLLRVGNDNQFYLVDARPLIFSIQNTELHFNDGLRSLSGRVELNFDFSERVKLASFLAVVNQSGGKISAKALTRQISNLINDEVNAQSQIVSGSNAVDTDLVELALQISQGVSDQVQARFGLSVALIFNLGQGKFSEAITFGKEVKTRLTQCEKCNAEMAEAQKFCTSCGAAAEQNTSRTTPLQTHDGKVVQLSVNISYLAQEKDPFAFIASDYERIVSAAIAKYELAALSTPQQLANLESDFLPLFQTIARSQGLEVYEVTVLDIKDPNAGWLIGMEAELEKAKQEAYIGREWLLQQESEIEIESFAKDIAIKRKRMEMTFSYNQDEALLEDRESRQQFSDRSVALDKADAQRQHELDQALNQLAIDVQRSATRESRIDADEQLAYDMSNEHKVVDHDINLAKKSMAFDTEKLQHDVQNRAYQKQAEHELNLKVKSQNHDLDHKIHEQQQQSELNSLRAKQDLQLDKMKAMADLDAQIAERELQEKKQEQEHKLNMRSSLKGLSASEILAAQAAELAESKDGSGVASAIASGLQSEQVNNLQQEMYERLIAEKNRDADLQRELVNTALGSQNQAQQELINAHKEQAQQAKDMSERSMDAMANVAAVAAKQPTTVHNKVSSEPSKPTKPVKQESTSPKQINTENNTTEQHSCPDCQSPMTVNAIFCGECGYRV